MAPPVPAGDYQRIGIIGGGTAGYLTALTLRRLRPELDVTVIESDAIPPIGVGESTTTEIVSFLHGILGFDIGEFFRDVMPTWKLGIRFEWGKPGDGAAFAPFDRGRLLEARIYDGHIVNHCFSSLLMSRQLGPVLNDRGNIRSLLPDFGFGYHVDNHRLITYLRRQLVPFGVRHLSRTIEHVKLADNGEDVAELVDSDGQTHRFDLYIDCTGFRSLLMGESLGSPFVDYSGSLFTNCALAGSAPNDGRIDPYTTATTMNCGWSWKIPQLDSDHRGYVFSTDFISADEAEAEFRRRVPGIGEVRAIPFRSGRRADFWKGNVVANGNAYGFVEPLQSTALNTAIIMALLLAKHLPRSKNNVTTRSRLNNTVTRIWDSIRWLLAVHFKFNRRCDSGFWKACQNDTDASGADYIVQLFQEGAPLQFQPGYADDEFVPAFLYDLILFGFDVPAKPGRLTESREQFNSRKTIMQHLCQFAVPNEQALSLVMNQRPDLLQALVTRPDSWLRLNAEALLQVAAGR